MPVSTVTWLVRGILSLREKQESKEEHPLFISFLCPLLFQPHIFLVLMPTLPEHRQQQPFILQTW